MLDPISPIFIVDDDKSADFQLGPTGELSGFPENLIDRVYLDAVTTLCFSGDQVAFLKSISSDDGGKTAKIVTSAQVFEATDLVEIDILNSCLREDGEFDCDDAFFSRVSVTRDGKRYDFRVRPGARICTSGATEGRVGRNVAQGDSFFATAEGRCNRVKPPHAGPFSKFSAGRMVFATDATFAAQNVTSIPRFATIRDQDGSVVGRQNANFYFAETVAQVPCFAAGTGILTMRGAVRVEDLETGDQVLTRDNGYQQIRWIASRLCTAVGSLAPIRVKKGALCNTQDLLLSPRHKVLVTGWKAEMLFGEDEMLVPIKHLCNGRSIFCERDLGFVMYYHLLCDHHEVVFADGAPVETLDYAFLAGLPVTHPDRQEVEALFPGLLGSSRMPGSARPAIRSEEGHLFTQLG